MRSFYTKCSYQKQARQGARGFAESFFLIYRLSCLFAFRNESGEARDGLRTKLTLSVIEVVLTHPFAFRTEKDNAREDIPEGVY